MVIPFTTANQLLVLIIADQSALIPSIEIKLDDRPWLAIESSGPLAEYVFYGLASGGLLGLEKLWTDDARMHSAPAQSFHSSWHCARTS